MDRENVLICDGCGMKFPQSKLIPFHRHQPGAMSLLFCRKCVLRLIQGYRAWIKERLS
jgi:hypothetical protein